MQTTVPDDDRVLIKAFRTEPRPTTPSPKARQYSAATLERLLTTWPRPTRSDRFIAAAAAGLAAIERIPAETRRAWTLGWRPAQPERWWHRLVARFRRPKT